MADLVPFDAIELAVEHLSPGRVKLIISALKVLAGGSNPILDARLSREFRELMDDMSADTTAKVEALMRVVVQDEQWREQPEHMRPTRADVTSRAIDHALAQLDAGHHGKRKMLWNAFFSSFDPKFYRNGWSAHLWTLAKQLEYPECRKLAEVVQRPQEFLSQPDGTEDRWLAERLISLGLARMDRGRHELLATDVGRRLKEFVWDDEMSDADGTPPAT